MTYASRRDRWCSIFGIVSVVLLFFGTEASSLDTIHMAITGKNFQHVIYPIAQEKGYMREEGIDLKLLIIGATPSIQALFAGGIQFTCYTRFEMFETLGNPYGLLGRAMLEQIKLKTACS